MCFAPGRVSDITPGREISTAQQESLWIDITDAPRAQSSKCWRLPGIGKYTAHAVASFAFNRTVPIVEANIARVLARLFNFRESIDSAVARENPFGNTPQSFFQNPPPRTFNSALLDLGALVCVARKPKCGLCPVKAFCRAKEPEALPVKKSSPSDQTRLIETHALITLGGVGFC